MAKHMRTASDVTPTVMPSGSFWVELNRTLQPRASIPGRCECCKRLDLTQLCPALKRHEESISDTVFKRVDVASVEHIQNSAEKGCDVCGLIWQTSLLNSTKHPSQRSPLGRVYLEAHIDGSIDVVDSTGWSIGSLEPVELPGCHSGGTWKRNDIAGILLAGKQHE